jgi:hypothetical protein
MGGKTEEHQVNMVSKGTVARDETSRSGSGELAAGEHSDSRKCFLYVEG